MYKHNTQLLIFNKYVYTYVHIPIYILKNGRINQNELKLLSLWGGRKGKKQKEGRRMESRSL